MCIISLTYWWKCQQVHGILNKLRYHIKKKTLNKNSKKCIKLWNASKWMDSHKKIKNKIKRWMEKPESALNYKKKKKRGVTLKNPDENTKKCIKKLKILGNDKKKSWWKHREVHKFIKILGVCIKALDGNGERKKN